MYNDKKKKEGSHRIHKEVRMYWLPHLSNIKKIKTHDLEGSHMISLVKFKK